MLTEWNLYIYQCDDIYYNKKPQQHCDKLMNEQCKYILIGLWDVFAIMLS